MSATTLLGKVMITPRGAYNSATAYVALDAVTYNGSSFLALKSITGITPVDDGVNYQLLSKAGAAFLAASGAPASGTGNDGDTYLDDVSGLLYGPKSNGAWPGSPVDISDAVKKDLASSSAGKGADLVYDAAKASAVAAALGNPAGFQQAGTGAVVRTFEDKARELISARDFGAAGDGATDDTDSLNAALAASGTNYSARLFSTPNANYLISGTAGVSMPKYYNVDARGVTISLDSEAATVNLNTGVDITNPNATLGYHIAWMGGYFNNTAQSGGAIGITALGVRMLNVRDTFMRNVAIGIKACLLDTFNIGQCYFTNCGIGFNMPSLEASAPSGANIQINTYIDRCYFAGGIDATSNHIQIDQTIQNTAITKCSFNKPLNSAIKIAGNAATSRCLAIKENHFEQCQAGNAYIDIDGGTPGFNLLSLVDNFFFKSGGNLDAGIKLNNCTTVGIERCGFDHSASFITGNGSTTGVTVTAGSPVVTLNSGSTSSMIVGAYVHATGVPQGTTVQSIDSATQVTLSQNATASAAYTPMTVNNHTPILLGSTCRSVHIDDCLFSTAFPVYLCDRSQITLNNGYIPHALKSIYAGALTGANSQTIDMRAILSVTNDWPVLPPKAYDLLITGHDSASASASSCYIEVGNSTSIPSAQYGGVDLTGRANNAWGRATVRCPADEFGQICLLTQAGGSLQCNVYLLGMVV